MHGRYQHTLDAITAAIGTETDPKRAMETTVQFLARHLEHYTWTGIYLLEGNELCLGP